MRPRPAASRLGLGLGLGLGLALGLGLGLGFILGLGLPRALHVRIALGEPLRLGCSGLQPEHTGPARRGKHGSHRVTQGHPAAGLRGCGVAGLHPACSSGELYVASASHILTRLSWLGLGLGLGLAG